MGIQDVKQISTMHRHNKADGSDAIDPRDLLGFPVFTSVPTHAAPEGTIVLYDDGSANRGIYAMLGGAWRGGVIT